MTDPVDDTSARNRWLAINLFRLSGAVFVVLGIMTLTGRTDLPDLAGWIFLLVGLFDMLVLPALLARKWRTPRP